MPVLPTEKLRFGPFELDLQSSELSKFGQKLKLQGHPVQVLSILLENPGQLVTREKLRERLWPAETETFVDFEHGLNTAIRKLRVALGDEAETPQYIETLPRRGYRFVGQLSRAEQPSTADTNKPLDSATPPMTGQDAKIAEPGSSVVVHNPATPEAILPHRRAKGRVVVLIATLFVIVTLAVVVVRSGWFEPSAPRIVAAKQLTFSGIVGNWMGETVENYASIQSDGRRVYYSVNSHGEEPQLRSVPIGGGVETMLASPIPSPAILHMSPDGSTLLVKEPVGQRGDTESAIWLLSTDGSSWRRLADVEAHDGAWAPDGKTIVFAKGREIYLTDLQGNTPAKLASISGRATWLRWSPDGRELRFTVIDSDRRRSTLWTLGSDGKLRQLLTQWKDAGLVCCGVWTTDGQYFLFRNYRNNRLDYWVLSERNLVPGRSQPTLLSPSGLQITAAAVSPSEKKIFVLGLAPSTHVLKLEAQTGRTSAAFPDLQALRFAFSRDGQFMAYTNTARELWRTRKDQTDRLQLTVPPMEVFMAQYSPDGRRIAFMARLPNRPWKIYWVSSDGGAMHEIASKIVNQADPNWSSDGQSILFGQPPDYWGGGMDGHRALYHYDLRTEQTTEISGSEGLFSPRWSPDYRYIAAISADFQSMSVFDAAIGRWRLLLHHPVHNPFWSPDSQWIYFNQSARIWRVRVTDARLEEVPLHTEEGRCQVFSSSSGFAPDGSILLVCTEDFANIYALDWE